VQGEKDGPMRASRPASSQEKGKLLCEIIFEWGDGHGKATVTSIPGSERKRRCSKGTEQKDVGARAEGNPREEKERSGRRRKEGGRENWAPETWLSGSERGSPTTLQPKRSGKDDGKP